MVCVCVCANMGVTKSYHTDGGGHKILLSSDGGVTKHICWVCSNGIYFKNTAFFTIANSCANMGVRKSYHTDEGS